MRIEERKAEKKKRGGRACECDVIRLLRGKSELKKHDPTIKYSKESTNDSYQTQSTEKKKKGLPRMRRKLRGRNAISCGVWVEITKQNEAQINDAVKKGRNSGLDEQQRTDRGPNKLLSEVADK